MRNKNQFSKNIKRGNYKFIYFITAFILLCSHDLFLKMETYFLEPNQETTLFLYNGTFEKSENIITRDRMLDASIISHDERQVINADQWEDKDSTITLLNFKTAKAGTYVAGVSTRARNIELTADKFNSYLKHDGVLGILEQRKKDNTLDQDAVESYQKHVKAIFQVGDIKTNDWKTEFGYPIEFIPLDNPYEKYSGDTLAVKLLLDGKPLSNQLVYANHVSGSHSHSIESQDHSHGDEDHSHDQDNSTQVENSESNEDHSHTHGQELRTNNQGEIFVSLPRDGVYCLRTIHMVQMPEDDMLTHESKWATVSFEVSHKHGSETHTHEENDDGIPTWIFILGSLLIIGLLFFIFRKKN